jgi:nitrate/TMAO reductase-like tetraheme cytochrome c subunit
MKREPGILKRVRRLVQKEETMKKAFIISGLILASLFLAGAKYDYLLQMDEKTVKSSECNECHKLIYEEWSKDLHSKAFVNDPFKKGTKNYGAEECISCHAAQEIANEKNLKTRPVHKEEGVNCTTCHLKNNMIYGPYKLTAKHKSEQDESMLKSEFCSGCHMPTFQEWQASGSKRTCQECHMPRVERKAVQGFPISMFVPNRMVGQHTQSYEKLLKETALITGEAGKGSLKISLTNRAGGHNMPTGKYGDYRIVLNTQVKDTDGKTIFSKEESFSTLKKNGVPPQKAVTFEYPISLETGKRYKVNSTLLYQVEGRPEQSVVIWNAEIEGGK